MKVISNNSSLFFKFSISETLQSFSSDESYCRDLDYYLAYFQFSYEISSFYIQNGWKNFDEKLVNSFFKNGSYCAIYMERGKVVAAMWIHTDKLFIDAPSFFSLQKNRRRGIKINNDTIYSSHNLVSLNYRGKRILSNLIRVTLEKFKDEKKYYFYMTGPDGKSMLNFAYHHRGNLFFIVAYSNILKVIWFKKIIYLQNAEKCWIDISRRFLK